MDDRQLDRMMSAASPVNDAAIHALDLTSAESELLEDIVATKIEEPTLADVRVTHRRRTRIRLVTSLTAVAAVSLIAAGVVGNGGREPRFGTLARSVAEANLRILPGTPGWTVVRADEFTVDQGEMTFGNGDQTMDVRWEPSDQYHSRIEKGEMEGEDRGEVQVLGRRAKIWRYAGTTDYVTTLPPEGSNYIYIRGDLGSEGAYRAVLGDLRAVDVDTWLEAMPPSVIRPDARAATVDVMLSDVPLPPGFDTAPLRSGEQVKDRYQLGARVTGAIACGWLDRWSEAKASGDDATADEAVAAMKTSHDWRVLREMNGEGDYPEVLWEIADAMDGGRLASGKGMVPLTDPEQYRSALGCGTG